MNAKFKAACAETLIKNTPEKQSNFPTFDHKIFKSRLAGLKAFIEDSRGDIKKKLQILLKSENTLKKKKYITTSINL